MARPKSWLSAIEQAADWVDLSMILAAAQKSFERGRLTRQQAERLAIRAAVRADQVPRDAEEDALRKLWTEEKSGDETEKPKTAPVCRACKQSTWWDNAGRKTCPICHPQPQKQIDEKEKPKAAGG